MASAVVTAHQQTTDADPAIPTVMGGAIAPTNSSSRPATSSHQRSFSTIPPPPLAPAARTGSLDAAPRDIPLSQMSQPQSQPSAQPSFTMSQTQSQPPPSYPRHQLPDLPRLNGQEPPQIIYSAVYSGVDVYEMEVNGIAVMRRRNDSWLNATQILKVARIEKGKRTKILEKEIQTGEHEKVQGGYGKYQGTWIRFERGVEVCKQYHVEELLRPLLTYDMGQDGGVAGRGDLNTPTKEQAMAAQRKRMYSAGHDLRSNGLAGTFFKNISSTASNAVAAISKARFDSPGPRGRNGPTRPPSFSRQSSLQNIDEIPPTNSQQSFASEYGREADPAYSTQITPALTGDEPPRKRQRIVTPAEAYGYGSQSAEMYGSNFPGSPTEPNDSFSYSQVGINVQDPDGNFLPPLRYDRSSEADNKRGILMGVFMDNKGSNDNDHVPMDILRSLSPVDLDSPIDAASNTALHWAATLARMPLLRALISAGANPCRVNASGETALMRASAVTNNSEQVSFPELLDVLGHTIEIRDKRGRTVLHHIALASAVKGRSHSSRYYLESLLEWVVRQGSAPSSQTTTNGNTPVVPKMGIGRFMSEIVNAQDKSGDTALGIASRVGNRSIISQLLEVGADPNIANAAGLRPSDFGVGDENGDNSLHRDPMDGGVRMTGSGNMSRESSDDIVTSITHLLNETSNQFQADMKKKQADLDALHAALRLTSTQLNDARRRQESLQAAARSQLLTRQKLVNLTRGREEENKRLTKIEQSQGPLDQSSLSWETDLQTLPALGEPGERMDDGTIPSATVLRARIQALKNRTELTRTGVASLKSRSKDIEIKYRKVVALCAGISEDEVDGVLDGLVRAVESEKGELEIGRVRRFLGGVDPMHG